MTTELLRVELDDQINVSSGQSDDIDFNEITFELISPVDLSDPRKVEIYKGLYSVEDRLAVIDERIQELNCEIDKLTCCADWLDYTVAIASGIVAGAIDSFFVGEFSLERGKNWANEKMENIVKKVAAKTGYKGDSTDGAIRHLENKYKLASDSVTDKFGGGLHHHLRDFSHHPTIVGLFFSMLTQFTGMSYGTNKLGSFISVPVEDKLLIGKNLPEKISFGLVNWFFHMFSDLLGSAAYAGAGTGLPGPILSLAKELSSISIFNDIKVVQELRVKISKLFNGTLLAKRDADGKILKDENGKRLLERFDLRAEMGVAHEIGRQAIPVIINEALVRGFYFIRHLIAEIKEKKNLGDIEWKKTLPFNNRTIARMITVASGTFMAVDLSDAAIRAVVKSGGFNPATLANFILRVNFVGVGRFAVAVTTDAVLGIKKIRRENEKLNLMTEKNMLLVAKVFYKQGEMWIAAEEVEKSLDDAKVVVECAANEMIDYLVDIQEGSERRKAYIDRIIAKDKVFADELLDIMEWG